MPLSSTLLLALRLGPTPEGYGTGLEWLPVAAIVVPVVVLLLIVWLGSKNTV